MRPTKDKLPSTGQYKTNSNSTNEIPKCSTPVSVEMGRMPVPEYGFPYPIPLSNSNACKVTEESTFRNYGIPNMPPLNMIHIAQNQLRYMYQLGGGDPRNLYMDYTYGDANPMRLSPQILPHALQAWPNIQGNPYLGGGINANNVINNYNKIPHSSSFSNYFARQSSKGKEVVSSSPNPFTECKEKMGVFIKDASAMPMKSTAKIEPYVDGINLREWMKSQWGEKSKIERLHVFRQIVEFVDFAHKEGIFLKDLRPSCFVVLASNTVKYIGSSVQLEKMSIMHPNIKFKRPLDQEMSEVEVKKQKINIGSTNNNQQDLGYTDQWLRVMTCEWEKNWYSSPEELNGSCLLASNIYSLGVLLFELLCCFETFEAHYAAMMELRQRILTPSFPSKHPEETGFCLWLLHPIPSSRPTTREILQSSVVSGSEGLDTQRELQLSIIEEDKDESDLLDFFLNTMKETKEKQASDLAEKIRYMEEDIKEIERRQVSNYGPHPGTVSDSNLLIGRLTKNMKKLETTYFYKRSQSKQTEIDSEERLDKELIRTDQRKSIDCLTDFFHGMFKFGRYTKFEACGHLRSGDLLNSGNVISSLSFDRDEEYIAAAGVSRKIKVFEFDSLMNRGVDNHYPVFEISNKSKFSCVCWNKYIKNYLVSTDYDGVVQMWDANTGQGVSQYVGHQKRAWSVDFSQVDPMKFASGSDDCSVKLWRINEKSSIGSIQKPANICCVQFSQFSSHLLAFGGADYQIYGYDLRHTKIPWCTLEGHGKAVSYVKFIDSETLVSASTDNSIKIWDLNKTNFEGLSPKACTSTLTGHTNEKNFVGLSVFDGYIASGSETNEVYAYHKSLPIPITSYKLECVDPISGHESIDSNGQFVSSVCWRGKSDMVIAANSYGSIKLLKMV